MIVRVRLFAAARQAAQCEVVELELPAPATVADVRRQLATQFPALAAWAVHLLFALNHHYVTDAAPVPPEAEVVAFPPVSGG